MTYSISLVILAGAMLWLVFVAGLMAARPHAAREGLAAMGSTLLIHLGEHALRGLAGLALIVAAGPSRFPQILTGIGIFILASSILIAAAPRRWHNAYARMCARLIPPAAMRVLSPVPLILAGLLVWALVRPAP